MRTFALLTALVVPALLVAAPVPKDDKKIKDEEAILGTWKIDKFDTGGGPGGPPQAEIDKIRFIFEKDGKMKFVGGPGGENETATYSMDSAAKVKTLDITITRPGGKPDTALGIYELDGDTFKWCMSEGSNKARPEELKPDGKRTVVVTFTRVKDDKKDK